MNGSNIKVEEPTNSCKLDTKYSFRPKITTRKCASNTSNYRVKSNPFSLTKPVYCKREDISYFQVNCKLRTSVVLLVELSKSWKPGIISLLIYGLGNFLPNP